MVEKPLSALLVITPTYLYAPEAQGERGIEQILL